MAKVRTKLNVAGIRRILQVDSQPVIDRIASRVAGSVTASVGMIDGHGVDAMQDAQVGKQRYRRAVVLKHPSAKGRAAANRAAETAIRNAG